VYILFATFLDKFLGGTLISILLQQTPVRDPMCCTRSRTLAPERAFEFAHALSWA
jgi:hypothetical protein